VFTLQWIAASLAYDEYRCRECRCRVFNARFAEIRVGSGALANLYAFMATCRPGDSIIVPPPSIGGHITHNRFGAAGLYGLDIHECPVDARHFTIDLDGLAVLAQRVQPRLITMGASLNLLPTPCPRCARSPTPSARTCSTLRTPAACLREECGPTHSTSVPT
jgi:glycine/serine hydroxymethyltransferase